MPESFRLDAVLAKVEGTYGTDSVPVAATDSVRISRRLWSLITLDYQWENRRLDTATGTLIPVKPAIPRGRKVRLDIFWEVKGAGVDAPPEAAPLFIAGGYPETDGAQLFDYGPLTSGVKGSATIYGYASGLLFKCVGCRTRPRWPLVVGEIAVHQFTAFGYLGADPATTALVTPTYDTPEPIAGVNTALTIGAWTPDWLSGEVDPSGVDPELLMSGNATDGIASFDFGSADPQFRLSARKVALATYDPYADLKARTSRNLVMTWGSAQFNRVKIVSAPLSILSHGHADSEGFANWDLVYQIESGLIFRFD
jgi:hypothetical protein